MFEFNKDVKTRDEMIFGRYEPSAYAGGIRRFEGLSLELVKKLIELKFINPDDAQNYSPTINGFIEYAEDWEDYEFGGYVVSIDRDDYRVSIDSIEKSEPISKKEMVAFVKMFRDADEFSIEDGLYAWYD